VYERTRARLLTRLATPDALGARQAAAELAVLDARAAEISADPPDLDALRQAADNELLEVQTRRHTRYDLRNHRLQLAQDRASVLAAHDAAVDDLAATAARMHAQPPEQSPADLPTIAATVDGVVSDSRAQRARPPAQRTDNLTAIATTISAVLDQLRSALSTANAERDAAAKNMNDAIAALKAQNQKAVPLDWIETLLSPSDWWAAFNPWKEDQDAAVKKQDDARTTLDNCTAKVGALGEWILSISDTVAQTTDRAARLNTMAADLSNTESALAELAGPLADHTEARAIVTARLLAAPPTTQPLVLLPLRLHTKWDAGTLHVRIYPDDISVDRHDDRLTAAEVAAAEGYWATAYQGVVRPAPRSYTIVPGDTLSGIAESFYGDAGKWPDIYNANRDTISDPTVIYAGQVLYIPPPPPAPPTYTVVAGDTLSGIAERFYGDATLWIDIYQANRDVIGEDPNFILADQVLDLSSSTPSAVQAAQAWQDLVRRTDAQRGAWIVRATDPATGGIAAAERRDSPWDSLVTVRLLPDRFAVVAYAAGEPLNLAPAGQPASYVIWGADIPDPLPVPVLHETGDKNWTNDLATAIETGMAVSITIPNTAPAIDQLIVVGVRTRPGELADLLDAHAYSTGVEILADGAPTNNTTTLRAAHTAAHDADIAALLVDPTRPTDCPDGSAGAQLAELLGMPRTRLAAVTGATTDRQTLADATRQLVGQAVTGPLRDILGTDFPTAWPLLTPGGPAPTLRVGPQPYAVLPTTAPARWQPIDDETPAALLSLLQNWANRHTPPIDIDPAAPPAALTTARHVTRADESALPTLLLEAASSLSWADTTTTYTGLVGLVGPTEGPQSPSAYLTALARATTADLPAIAATLPPALLARIALAAKYHTDEAHAGALAATLNTLAEDSARGGGPADLARALTEHLDALSHRIDAWVSAAAHHRLTTQRTTTPTLGTYGYLTDVHPDSGPRSYGHIHAPSLSHAATAAVLRAGYLGQRRAAWAAKVISAQAQRDAAQRDARHWQTQPQPTGLESVHWAEMGHALTTALTAAQHNLDDALQGRATLQPLDPVTEAELPLVIDVSSRRVRQARAILSAVRQGQPLAAVLGYQFERDLTDAGLQRYLPAFRKLTRFHTGTALEALEAQRETAQTALDTARAELAALRKAVLAADGPIAEASAAVEHAQQQLNITQDLAGPYLAMQAEKQTLDTVTIPQDRQALAGVEQSKPTAASTTVTIQPPPDTS
jgi:nucleoid-associated protein YgaU